MSADTFRKWEEFNHREREQVTELIVSLREFRAGHRLSIRIAAQSNPVYQASYLDRFFLNGEIVYLHSYFAASGSQGIKPVLESIHCQDLFEPIEAILDRDIRGTVFRSHLDAFRNKLVVHRSFAYDAGPMAVITALEHEDADPFFDCVVELMALTLRLLEQVTARYPHAARLVDLGCGPVDNSL